MKPSHPNWMKFRSGDLVHVLVKSAENKIRSVT